MSDGETKLHVETGVKTERSAESELLLDLQDLCIVTPARTLVDGVCIQVRSGRCTAVIGQVRKRPKTLGSSARTLAWRRRAARSIS